MKIGFLDWVWYEMELKRRLDEKIEFLYGLRKAYPEQYFVDERPLREILLEMNELVARGMKKYHELDHDKWLAYVVPNHILIVPGLGCSPSCCSPLKIRERVDGVDMGKFDLDEKLSRLHREDGIITRRELLLELRKYQIESAEGFEPARSLLLFEKLRENLDNLDSWMMFSEKPLWRYEEGKYTDGEYFSVESFESLRGFKTDDLVLSRLWVKGGSMDGRFGQNHRFGRCHYGNPISFALYSLELQDVKVPKQFGIIFEGSKSPSEPYKHPIRIYGVAKIFEPIFNYLQNKLLNEDRIKGLLDNDMSEKYDRLKIPKSPGVICTDNIDSEIEPEYLDVICDAYNKLVQEQM